MNKLRKGGMSSLLLTTALVLVGGFFVAPVADAAVTLNVISNSTNAAYYNAIVKTADRLVTLQNANGSWDWVVTGKTGPTSNTYLNITGATAEGLLSAHEITGKQVYLNAAVKAGDFIISGIDVTTPRKINGENVLFLKKLSDVSGDQSYKNKASEYFGMLYSSAPSSVCATGCVDSAGIVTGQKATRASFGNPNGIVLWDLLPYVEYANLVGDTTHAEELANAIITEANLSGYTSSVTSYSLGLVSALHAAAITGNPETRASNMSILEGKIGPAANSDGSFGTLPDGRIQTTSFALKAFISAGDPDHTNSTASYIMNSTGRIPTGGWVDTDNDEYSESDSEAITTLATLLPEGVQYYTIQAAVDAASDGDIINVASGTYNEQVKITKSVFLLGAKAGVDARTRATTGESVIENVCGPVQIMADGVTIDGFTIQGSINSDPCFIAGIWANPPANGTHGGYNILNNIIQNNIIGITPGNDGTNAVKIKFNLIKNNNQPGPASGSGIYVDFGIHNVQITSNVFDGNQVNIIGPSASDITFSNNEIHDVPASGLALYSASNIEINGNSIYANTRGIRIGGGDDNIEISGNTLTNNTEQGVVISDDDGAGPSSNVSLKSNYIWKNVGAGLAVNSGAYTGTFSAIKNFWGLATGPTNAANPTGTGDAVMGDDVSFAPWYTNDVRTTLSDNTHTDAMVSSSAEGQAELPTGATEVVLSNGTVLNLSNSITSQSPVDVAVGGNTVTLTQSVVLESGVDTQAIVLTNSNLADVSASIPDGTTIQGPSGWDGKIAPPVSDTSGGNAPAGFNVGSSAISIGSPLGTLIFDNPVTILLANVTGTVGYKPSGSTQWILISNTCAGTYDAPTGAVFPGECKISNSTDTKIVTYHFTSFAGLDVVVNGGAGINTGGSNSGSSSSSGSTNNSNSGSGSNSGGGSNSGPVAQVLGASTVNAAVTSTVIAGCDGRTTGFSITTGTSCVGNTGTAATVSVGQVLGDESFHFSLSARKGAFGDEVKELQRFLNKKGFDCGNADGKFGAKTRAAVIKFQIAHGLVADGIVGPKVRAALNK